MLDSLNGATPEELLQNWPDGRIKLFLTQRLLRFRRDHAGVVPAGKIFAAHCQRSLRRLLCRVSPGSMKANGLRSSSRDFPRASVFRRSARSGKIRWWTLPESLSRDGARELFTAVTFVRTMER